MHDEARYHALLAGLPYPDAVSFPERVMLAQPVGKLVAAAEDAVACRSHSLECLTRHLQRAEIATHRGFDVDAAAARLRAHVPAALTAVRSYLDDFWPTRLSALKAAVEAHPEAPKAQEAQETRDAQHD